ncbi:pyridoxine/pyridoxamine 5'-phosphate oxidase [Devosia pacifica]|uniref:Pyridoxine/pyridoxamine 5'-phosphate oxidase n=1 Tax=Devosia pacifica TaxID=1335967 RepID=A0A918VW24_9HYPH|nr:pyridoxamine 5'-phosphate oxidase [Devosia pacifica]GHA30130.1 pyridoxine/pyridoxamine 5'-phosphate oxidase [Devosia pacifica]
MSEALTARLFDDADLEPLDPFAVFEEWFAIAQQNEVNDANAMALASVDENGLPDVRMVLLNERDERGYCFFTNFESAKGQQLLANSQAALCFHWKSMRRQIRIRGAVEQVSTEEADKYFASRSKGSRIASSVSDQSRPLESRAALAARVARKTAEIGESEIDRPAHWSGFRVLPTVMEFWKDGEFRLHDRVQFTRESQTAQWSRQRLFP